MTVYHKHHIIPKHMGGSDDSYNLVEVTVEEHAELHRQLWEELGHWQDEIAWRMLSGQITSAEATKLAQKRPKTQAWKDMMSKRMSGEKHRYYGQTLPEATKKKLSDALSGENNPMFGKTHSEEVRQKISESRKNQVGKKRGPYKGKTEYSQGHVRVINRNG
jgi:hypothetical protein